jgi:bacterial/archaeal transporter family-2 protein
MLKFVFMAIALIAGSMVSFQAPINARLGSIMGGPMVAAFCSFAVGTVALGLILVLTGNFPRFHDINATAPWMWVGGLLGSIFVFVSIFAVPVLGAALMIALFIAGQIVGALIIDKTGFLLPEQIDIGWERVLALVLILAGAALFARSVSH